MMENRGQIYATDTDGRRLMPIFPRLERANARNVQVRAPKGQQDVLGDLAGRCDVVFVDAPCTGTGAWRRNPDAKWRVRPGALEQRMKQQDEVLDRATAFVKPGGALIYVTCSVLRAENEDRVAAFLERHPRFLPRDAAHMARRAGVPALAEHASPHGPGLRLSPASTGTDGFYIAALVAP
jgi:16S rRNA (cytosine967-C5)-methyltransferase